MPETISHDARQWIAIRAAAKLIRRSMVLLREDIAAGKLDALELDGRLYIPLGAANKAKREIATLRSIARRSRVGDTLTGAYGILSEHRDHQDVLPMSSGRAGRGWSGQKLRS